MIVLDTIKHPFSRCWKLASVLTSFIPTINQHMHYTIELLHTPTARFKFETESFIIRTQIEKLRWINNLKFEIVSCIQRENMSFHQRYTGTCSSKPSISWTWLFNGNSWWNFKHSTFLLNKESRRHTWSWHVKKFPESLMADVFEKIRMSSGFSFLIWSIRISTSRFSVTVTVNGDYCDYRYHIRAV